MKKLIVFLLLSSGLISFSCILSPENENPKWLEEMINTFETEPVGNPAKSVWQYEYNDEIVYYFPAQCCDQYSELYNKDGELLCAPDGGFAGHGDGNCTDFFTNRKEEKLIWEDTRKP